jgi:hypothetical protein
MVMILDEFGKFFTALILALKTAWDWLLTDFTIPGINWTFKPITILTASLTVVLGIVIIKGLIK